MPWSRQEIEPALAELEGITALDRDVRKSAARTVAEINARAGTLSKLVVTGDEICMQVAFDDVLDLQTLLPSGVEIDVDIALRINDGRDSFRSNQVGSVGQTPQKEMFH